jgi:hypothetical protein
MSRIIIELDVAEDIKNRLESLIQKSQKIDSTDFKRLVRPRTGFLDKNEKIVFECIKEKPGQSKQHVVNSLESTKPPNKSLSRNPIYNALKSLIKRPAA